MGFFVFIVLILVFWVAPILVARWFGKMYKFRNAWLWGLFLGWLEFSFFASRLRSSRQR